MFSILKSSALSAAFALALYLVSCTPPVTKTVAVEPMQNRPVRIVRGDTLVYQIAFADSSERIRFDEALAHFIKERQFQAERYDSGGRYTFLKILPSAKGFAETPSAQTTTAAAVVPAGSVIEGAGLMTADTAPPPCGGTLKVYCPRGALDYPFSALVDADPFARKAGGDSMPGYFTVVNASPSAITLRLNKKIVNGAGKSVTVIDIINAWTRYVREHPAEGFALFRSCEGINAYISGQETIILGFSAIDNSTIRLKLAGSDPQAIERLNCSRVLPTPFTLGKYVLSSIRDNDFVLSPNRTVPEIPYVNSLTVRCGSDPNPLLSFSLGRYDAVLLSGSSDIEYGRRNLMKNGWCSLISRDRYFISSNLQDSAARAYIAAAISGGDLLRNFVKTEGAPIAAIESDSVAPQNPPPAPAAAAPAVTLKDPVTILFRKDDAISKTVAERLLAALSHANIPGTLNGSDLKSYETGLVTRSFGCAVGWVPATVVSEKSEKLRLSAMFFNDEQLEEKRIAEHRELPLFSVDWYVLAKEKVGLYKGKFNALYVKQGQK